MNQDVYPVLFCNTAWMRQYRGDIKNDPPQHGGRWITSGNTGSEIYNFRPYRGKVFGFVRSRYSIAIEKLGAEPDSDSVSGVRVYWTARHPIAGRCVIGWYDNATVYRYDEHRPRSGFKIQTVYNITAPEQDAHLIPPDERLLYPVPDCRKPGVAWGMGQSQVAYMKRSGLPFLRQLKKRLSAPVEPPPLPPPPQTPRQPDTAKKLAVEKAAMDAVEAHYKKNWELEDTSRTMGLGYDFLAKPRLTNSSGELYLEVKGCSGPDIACELTPSEFRCMQSRNTRRRYRLCIVTNALDKRKHRLSIFSYHPGLKTWSDEQSRILNITTLMGARCAAG